VAEILSFFCYCEIPSGHNFVLESFDQLMQFRAEHDRFDAWMSTLEDTIDGYGTGIGFDGSLMEYAVIEINIYGGECCKKGPN